VYTGTVFLAVLEISTDIYTPFQYLDFTKCTVGAELVQTISQPHNLKKYQLFVEKEVSGNEITVRVPRVEERLATNCCKRQHTGKGRK
jgi:hypothetical protein